MVAAAIALGHAACATAMILLGDSWFQLLAAGALGIPLTQAAFLEEDAAASTGLRRLVTGLQGWLFFPLLTLEGVNLYFLGPRHLLSREPVKGRWIELASLTARPGWDRVRRLHPALVVARRAGSSVPRYFGSSRFMRVLVEPDVEIVGNGKG